uniref:Uncharacterized protein n=1 Tax=Picea sitchensis TaxID=3332 RepID=A9NMG3_PICSI|nr:unknown [Picea sitchensis]ACN40896.1 unknown [Picea sitchensis]
MMASSPSALNTGVTLKPSVKIAPRSSPISTQKKKTKLSGLISYKSRASVRAVYNGNRESAAGDFLGGFLLGGVVFGALGYLLAPKISKSLWGERQYGVMKNMLKFLDEDDDVLETTRNSLNEKISQLNSAIDDVSVQLRVKDGARVSDLGNREVESAV